MIFYCVEPTDERMGNDYYDWKFLIKSGFSHHVAFPHVDSCLAVVCQLEPGRIFAGHINGFYQNDFSSVSHNAAFDNMVTQLNGATVNKAVVFGDVPNWRRTHGVDPAAKLNCANVTYLDSSNGQSYPQGIDVLFDVDNGSLKLVPYTRNRDFKAISNAMAVSLSAVNGVGSILCVPT